VAAAVHREVGLPPAVEPVEGGAVGGGPAGQGRVGDHGTTLLANWHPRPAEGGRDKRPDTLPRESRVCK